MERQLALIETGSHWRLDDRTCEIGRKGIATARAALAATARQPEQQDEADQGRSAA